VPSAYAVPSRHSSPGSIWNKSLPAHAPLDPGSAALVGPFDEEIATEGQATGAHGYVQGKSPRQLLTSFPWSHLQLLKMALHRIGSRRHKSSGR